MQTNIIYHEYVKKYSLKVFTLFPLLLSCTFATISGHKNRLCYFKYSNFLFIFTLYITCCSLFWKSFGQVHKEITWLLDRKPDSFECIFISFTICTKMTLFYATVSRSKQHLFYKGLALFHTSSLTSVKLQICACLLLSCSTKFMECLASVYYCI